MINWCISFRNRNIHPLKIMYSFHAQIELPHTPHPRPNPPSMINWCIFFFLQNRQIYPVGRIFSLHARIARPSPPFPHPLQHPLAFDQNQSPTSFKTPPPSHRLFDLQDTLYLINGYVSLHSCQILSPLRNGFYSFRAQTDWNHPVDPDSYTVVVRGVADLYT